ncbi:hypothetical protein N7516_005472 [Penicillium verrucosum]|uniref:uncharacterized protein n=1 Tax=Penicillium verrucosum TaxID=60171 RepID=UPI00254561C6|nr:uncharacterized protein N7516_005472 [Penicillium verrucosum]KAJ5945304.1 hypothetical protein N7516_005472 [Penicillium verrucosum]
MTPPTRGEVEARVKMVISKILHRSPSFIGNEYFLAFDVYTQTCYYGDIVEGLEKEFNFKWNYSKNIYDNDNVIEKVSNAIELCIYESTIQDPDWRKEHGLKD